MLERAFELAKSGDYSTVDLIRRRLRSEGYHTNQIEGPTLGKQLRHIISEARSGMPRGPKGEKRAADVISNAVKVMKIATGEDDGKNDEGKDKAAQSLGRKGGKARAAKMSAKERTDIAKRAARARWSAR